jgi:hypothetical protein
MLAPSASDLERCCRTDSVEQVRETLIDLTEIAKQIRMGHRGSVSLKTLSQRCPDRPAPPRGLELAQRLPEFQAREFTSGPAA